MHVQPTPFLQSLETRAWTSKTSTIWGARVLGLDDDSKLRSDAKTRRRNDIPTTGRVGRLARAIEKHAGRDVLLKVMEDVDHYLSTSSRRESCMDKRDHRAAGTIGRCGGKSKDHGELWAKVLWSDFAEDR